MLDVFALKIQQCMRVANCIELACRTNPEESQRHVSLRFLWLLIHDDLRYFERMRVEDIHVHLIEEVARLRRIAASSAALSDFGEVIDESEEDVRSNASNRQVVAVCSEER